VISKDKKLIVIVILIGIVSLAAMIGFIGKGNVRHVSIFWQERVEQTVDFEEVDGKTQLQGISGVDGEPNPYLVTRTGFAYILTVLNHGDKPHRLYIEGLDVQTNLLEPGHVERLTIHPNKEGVYKYYDKQERLTPLGFLEVKTVVASDEFTGIWRDLI